VTTDRAADAEIRLPSGARVAVRAETSRQAGALAEATARVVRAVETGEADPCRLRASPRSGPLPTIVVEARLGGWVSLDTVLRSIESLVGLPVVASASLDPVRQGRERRWRQGWAGRPPARAVGPGSRG
jgi:hypothetical protein